MKTVLFGGALAGAALALAAACSDTPRSHVYTGRQYEPGKGCLDHLTSIDVVAGPEPTTPCAPTCIVSLADDSGASQVYVSTMCGPYPEYPYQPNAGGDPRCAIALGLYTSNTTCELDGGITNPQVDAGGDAAADAGGSDAPND